MNYIIQTFAGDNFDRVAEKAKAWAVANNTPNDKRYGWTLENKLIRHAQFDFNGVTCIVSGKTNLKRLWRDYHNSHKLGWKTIGPDCVAKYDAKTEKRLAKYEEKRKKERAKEEKKREAIRKAKPKVRKFSLLQLFALVDDRLSTSVDDVYEMLNHITGDDLMTHHLPVAMDYIKKVNPEWLERITSKLERIRAYAGSNTFETLIGAIKDKYNEEYDIPTLTLEEKQGFGKFMVKNSLLLKKMKKKAA